MWMLASHRDVGMKVGEHRLKDWKWIMEMDFDNGDNEISVRSIDTKIRYQRIAASVGTDIHIPRQSDASAGLL